MYSFGRKNIGRIGGASFYSRFCSLFERLFSGLAGSGATLTVALYFYAKEQGEFEVAFAIAAILMIMALLINLSASFGFQSIQR